MIVINKFKALKLLLYKIIYILTTRQKKLLVVVIVMMFINGLLQTAGISVIVPSVTAMTDQDTLMQSEWIISLCNILKIESFQTVFMYLCLGTAILYLAKNIFGIFQNWTSAKYSNMVNRELSTMVLSAYMNRNYDFF